MRPISTLLVGAAALVALSTVSLAQTEPLAALYEQAKKEGKFVFWAPTDAPAVKRLAERFAKTFPGVGVDHFDIQGGPAIERMIAESRTGNMSVDLVEASLGYFKPLIDRNLIATSDWNAAGVAKDYIFLGGRVVNHYNLEFPITINTDKAKASDIKSWEDLADPKWAGRTIIEARGTAFAILSQKWGQEHALDLLTRILANKPLLIKGGTTTLEALAGGQGAVAVGASTTKIEPYKQNGAPVEWLPISPLPVATYAVALVQGAKHPNAAKLWTAWLLTAEGQQAMYDIHNMGVLDGPTATVRGKKLESLGVEIIKENVDANGSAASQELFSKKIGSIN